MAEYLDSEADVSEGEEELNQNEKKKLKKFKAMEESSDEEDGLFALHAPTCSNMLQRDCIGCGDVLDQ